MNEVSFADHTAPVQSLVSIAFRGMVGDSVDLELFGRADAERNAKTLADAARGLLALGRMGAGRDQAKEWLAFLDGIQIDQSGAGVNLRASIPAKTMESFVGQMMSAPRPEAVAPSGLPAREPQAEPGQAHPALSPSKAAPRGPAAPTPAAVPSRPPARPAGSPTPAGSPSPPAPQPRGTQTPSEGAP